MKLNFGLAALPVSKCPHGLRRHVVLSTQHPQHRFRNSILADHSLLLSNPAEMPQSFEPATCLVWGTDASFSENGDLAGYAQGPYVPGEEIPIYLVFSQSCGMESVWMLEIFAALGLSTFSISWVTASVVMKGERGAESKSQPH